MTSCSRNGNHLTWSGPTFPARAGTTEFSGKSEAFLSLHLVLDYSEPPLEAELSVSTARQDRLGSQGSNG